MSIKLVEPGSGSSEIFSTITLVENEPNSYFNLSNNSGDEIHISYIPILDSSWDKENFDVYVLDNPYLNAENDVFEIYESTLDERLGWIFPITILVSNDNDFSETKNLNKYKFVAQYKLLTDSQSTLQGSSLGNDYLITDIYNESSIICILNKQTTSKINNFKIHDYILSFYKYGYSFFQNNAIRKNILNKANFIQEMRQAERRRVIIRKSHFDITSNSYIESLFEKYLLKTDDFLVRFIFLYQIIEQLMEDEFGVLFQQFLTDYNSNSITKNDFKDYINTSSKERELIKSVFGKTFIDTHLKDEFESAFDFLYGELNYKIRKPLSDKIYDFRNLVTHSYRNIIDKIESINNLIQIFEEIIICALINYNTITSVATSSPMISV